jgi:hypothetical protein
LIPVKINCKKRNISFGKYVSFSSIEKIPALGRLRQEEHVFNASQGYIAKTYIKKSTLNETSFGRKPLKQFSPPESNYCT